MATEKIELPSTGIYRRKIESAAVSSDFQGLYDWQGMLEQSPSPAAGLPSLDELQDQAETFLRQYLTQEFGGSKKIPESEFRAVQSAGIDYVARRRVEATWADLNTKFQEASSPEEKRELTDDLRRVERANDARDMLHCLSVIRSQMKRNGSPEVAVSHGVWLGIAYERFRVRASERKAWTGAQTLQAASKGGVARKKTAQQYAELILKFRASGLSQRAYARTAPISVSALKYALKKLGSDPAK